MPKVILDVKLYSMEETAQLLGITRQTLTKYIKKGRVLATQIGGTKYISEDNLKKFLTEPQPE